ncbi:MAG: hypothetical protein R3F17_03265 [Planctomycetota bacterium]
MVLADLEMLRDKTRGNLEAGEEQTLDKAIEDMSGAVARLEEGE